MKNRNFFKNSIALLLPISMGIGVLFGAANKGVTEAFGYTASSLPTTIDLNPVEESDIRAYYANAKGQSGNDLLKALKPILKNNQKYYSYDSGDAVWKMYEIIDRDWKKSPASTMKSGSYDVTTNIITNYKYRNTTVEDPYVRALYVNRDAENPKTAWASHGERNKANTIEREHIWPKSHGFDSGTAAGARGDPMHLWAADGTANGMHSNLFYGYVDTSKTYKDAGNTHDILWGNLTGTSRTIGSGTVFEPQDSDKGDIARACFYMVARYNNLAGNDNDISGANPNLTLSTNLSENNVTGTSTSSQAYSLGLLQDLLEWNKIDPVDEFEIKRNDLLQVNFTNNRNPFIDFPQWADIIWGGEAGTAQPSSDDLNGGVAPAVKSVKSIEITTNPSKLTYKVGETFSPNGMVVTAHYSDNTSEVITNYTISKTSPLGAADKMITISYKGKSASIRITVEIPTGQTYYVKVSENQNDWTGEYMVVYEQSATSGLVWTGVDAGRCHTDATISDFVIYEKPTGAATISIAAMDGGYSVQINSGTNNGKYMASNNFNNSIKFYDSPLKNTISYSDDTTHIVGYSGSDGTTKFRYNKTASADGERFRYYKNGGQEPIQLYKLVGGNVVHPTSVSLDTAALNLEVNETEALTATVLPSNVTDNSVNWSSSDSTIATVDEFGVVRAVAPGTATITAAANDTYGNYSASCSVTVTQPLILSSLSLSGTYKTQYFVGDAFNTDDLTVTAHYTRGGVEASIANVTSECEFEGFDSETTGQKEITVIFDSISTSYNITVSAIPVEENTVTFIASQFELDNAETISAIEKDSFTVVFNSAASKYYDSGSAFRVYGGNTFTICGDKKIVSVSFVFAQYDGTNEFTTNTGTCNSTTGAWSNSSGVNSLTYTVGGTSGHRKIQQIIVKYDPDSSTKVVLTGITLSNNTKTSFTVGDTFSFDGVVTASYSDGSTANVTAQTSFTGYDLSQTGEQTVTATYEGKIATYEITVANISVPTTYSKISSLSQIDSTSKFIIGYENGSTLYAMPNTFAAQMDGISLTISNGKVSDVNDACSIYFDNIVEGDSNVTLNITNGSKYLNSTNKTSFTSADIGLAWTITVNGNGVFSFVNGSRGLIYRNGTETKNRFGNYAIDNVKNTEYFNVCLYKETPVTSYSLVTNVNDLGSGDEIIFVGNRESEYFSMTELSGASNSQIMNAASVTYSNGKVFCDSSIISFTIEKNVNLFKFRNDEGSFFATHGTTRNYVEYETVSTGKSQFSISVSEGGAATVRANTDTTKSTYLRFSYYSGNASFRCYIGESVSPVYIYKKSTQVEADTWSKRFLDETYGCKELATWNDLATSYVLLSNEAKAEIESCVSNASTDYAYRYQAMARYEYILSNPKFNKYNNVPLSDFIPSRQVVTSRTIKYGFINLNRDSNAILIVIFAVLGLSSIGGYYFLKKRKENSLNG